MHKTVSGLEQLLLASGCLTIKAGEAERFSFGFIILLLYTGFWFKNQWLCGFFDKVYINIRGITCFHRNKGERKMSRNKTATLIALFMTLLVAATLVTFLPTAKAAESVYTSYVYCAVNPDWVGVGQEVLLQWWTADMPPDVGEIVAAEGGIRAAWYNVGWYVTDPEGDTETITIDHTDPVGAAWSLYTPDQVGTYTVQAWFPETVKTSETDTYTYHKAESAEITFTVTEEQREAWPESPLPARPWARPINTAARDWYVLAGNWLGGDAQNYPRGARGGTTTNFVMGTGPESAHILWTKPYYAGGIMDEMYGVTGYETAHYQGLSLSVMIIQGKLYYPYRTDAHMTEGYIVADLYTGETLYYVNDTMPSRGQIYNYESPNQHGGYPYMYKTSGVSLPAGDFSEMGKSTWEMLDAYTGRPLCAIANVSFGTSYWWYIFGAFPVYGKDGSWLNYNFEDLAPFGSTEPDYYLQVWNSSAMVDMLGGPTGTDAWQWRPTGGAFTMTSMKALGYYVYDGNTAFSLNVSIPTSYVDGPKNKLENQTGEIQCVRQDEYLIVGTEGRYDERGVVKGKMTCLSLEPGNEGDFMWSTEFTPPFASIAENITAPGTFTGGMSMGGVYPEDGVITFYSTKQLKRWGYSLDTGELLWESETEVPMSFYGTSTNYYEGQLLTYGYGGQIRTYNITTGDILWNYNATVVGQEIGYGGLQPIGVSAIADGKLYTVCGEHSPTQPLWRGQNLRCINATSGEEIWKILFWGGGMSPTESNTYMADGIIVGLNLFDSEIYAFGKGPSATTVSAPQTVPTLGSSVTITGTVTDQTETGRRTTNDIWEFSLKGTPAISDEDMGAWMEYLFMHQAKPADAKGVEVILETLDPNGNFYEIGRVTSDMNGAYGLTWEPDVPGDYQIFARFEGSGAYGPSSASTYMSITDPPVPTPTPTPSPAPMTDTYVLGIGAGAIIAIIVVGLVLILMMRKR
jgi:outer membrane protein assembly factor BamB